MSGLIKRTVARIEVRGPQNMIVKMKGKMLGMGVATFFDAGGLQ
jgi:hypothetical protein